MQFAIYRFHIALQHITPRIWRRVELRAEYSLADLQRVIQIGMDWSDEYQHRFTIRNHFLSTARVGGLLLLGNPAEMTLWEFEFRLQERFRYEYNFFDGWTFDIRFEGQDVPDPNRIRSSRASPPSRPPIQTAPSSARFDACVKGSACFCCQELWHGRPALYGSVCQNGRWRATPLKPAGVSIPRSGKPKTVRAPGLAEFVLLSLIQLF
jgi:Plasmid pRiA4b ORF-3-like protein